MCKLVLGLLIKMCKLNLGRDKDKNGWFHIDRQGNELYNERYLTVEPFYNGFALATKLDNDKLIIDEKGKKIIESE